ncbi:ABC-2 type transport system permease protein [Novosphingobium capsulatum]|uniref:ABC-2 type transport system permease protein n=1 Tax=Novosphingobium capsulatum TaxID=13688 RepID=A0ABU1MK35_9SPHN|nr:MULTISPECIES: ABC transporter permease [Novosphingobium]MBB3359109.1 ABC-2 type transport system permease protein [Novosphingobium sp. BK256]MBB3375410.1 ABC-2 type transport system permease protein [Novosphingobium sp. BK280]MBB3379881.1 ABC-2 type transport system permease protein [Novosphingobium sp. BK258]MBB3421576.1 ABC-2 type transport system permease protein [Novosphingobium sp. BK267]MBB3449891.1 ABC-2 type transport system permease protein [Novosphingobium sp. BK352]
MIPEKLRAAWVIARRDFVAVIFSKSFVFFLLGPLFPIIVGGMAGAIGAKVQRDLDNPQIGIALPADEAARMIDAHHALADAMPGDVPDFVVLDAPWGGRTYDARAALAGARRAGASSPMEHGKPVGQLAAVVSGSLAHPVLTATPERARMWQGMIALFAAHAQSVAPAALPPVAVDEVASSVASVQTGQVSTAQAGQVALFLLTMLLAGMVLSNLVEEKANKIIEVLAASIPMDALFLGKLFAMLGVSLVGMAVWGAAWGGLMVMGMKSLPLLAAPAVGWPVFILLGFLYFAMAYLLLGSLFLSIGGMATTVREVQTLSMPVTMLQLMVFFFASYALARPGSWVDWAARVFPLSSPFAMLARAARDPVIWPHLLALGWQALCVMLIVRTGAQLFRRTVMKSGPARGRKVRKGGLLGLLKPDRTAQDRFSQGEA